MKDLSRRVFLLGLATPVVVNAASIRRGYAQGFFGRPSPEAMYGPVDDLYPVPAINLTQINPAFLRTVVPYEGSHEAGTVVVDPAAHYLYLVGSDGTAL